MPVYIDSTSLATSLRNCTLWYHCGVLPEQGIGADCMNGVSLCAALFGHNYNLIDNDNEIDEEKIAMEMDQNELEIVQSFFMIDQTTESFRETIAKISSAMSGDLTFLGILTLFNGSHNNTVNIDLDVVREMAFLEAKILLEIEATESLVREENLSLVDAFVTDLNYRRSKSILTSRKCKDFSEKLSVVILAPIQIAFLTDDRNDEDFHSKMIAQMKRIKDEMENYRFYMDNPKTLLSSNENAQCELGSDPSLFQLFKHSLDGDQRQDVGKNYVCDATKDRLTFKLVNALSPSANSDSSKSLFDQMEEAVPVPIVRTKIGNFKRHKIELLQKSVVLLDQHFRLRQIYEYLRRSVLRQMTSVFEVISKHSHYESNQNKELRLPQSHIFLPFGWATFLSIAYPQSIDDEITDEIREDYHRLFNLSFGRPEIRPLMAHKFQIENSGPFLLRDVHLSAKIGNQVGVIRTVQGHYDYHHYMQDEMDDSGWGCAYRSFQTIWSWFRLQGYTDKAVPGHAQIQQTLIEIGDRPASFLGSRQWIGSTELSFCLDQMLGITARILNVPRGSEMTDKARDIQRHFETEGTPVMIGGGVLAHTILGVDFNDVSGETRFLVLDPHYTGEDQLRTVVNKGWCGWKAPSFWKSDCFYNLLLPFRPRYVV